MARSQLMAVIQQHQRGDLQKAIVGYRAYLRQTPHDPIAYNNLGMALSGQGKIEDAVAAYRQAIHLQKDFAGAYFNLANAYSLQARLPEAIAMYEQAIALSPGNADIILNLGNALRDHNRLDEAITCYRKAIDVRPADNRIRNNLGNALRDQGAIDEAIRCYRRCITLDPQDAAAHHNLGNALLLKGDMLQGWVEHEWRWQMPLMRSAQQQFLQPQWKGESAEGQTILLHAEQGLGDTIQFCRYATLAASRGLTVIMEVQAPLLRLLQTLPGVAKVIAYGDKRPSFDLHCPLLSLPLAFRTTIDTVPQFPAYLQADASLVDHWRNHLPALPDRPLRVGLVWAGNAYKDIPARAAVDRRRSLSPHLLAPLLQMPGIEFFSLQKAGPAAPADFPLIDVMDQMTDFADTAALISQMDLVISVDTATAHLAGALGKPIWLLNRFDSCWRWLLGREDSPWYPSLRVYQQDQPGDWESVIDRVTADLRKTTRP
ncbi:tetratricopeptide repeat protein [Acidisoma cellulosilytica]|uniref:Tetratricopeptide repeat protein n=1 Tax=Acidisoma cellulosilyticum TaxID=2802395 RepID=A0A963Z4Q9_9PROT|nr:tetratricopeptide repeat protein [Acidisoma cellulosilyticum]MCB8881738.1 tetratricopeptide repeat protein [Acidisoma cellulosilyticum]